MSTRILILKDGVITPSRSPTDNTEIVNSISSSLVTSVNGLTGTITLNKSSVGLNLVDNTSDLSKPISTLTQSALDMKANVASPNLTGTPTTPTATAGTNTTQIANTAFVSTAIANLVSSSPTTLDTLNELATALGNDPNFATTITNSLALKAPLASPTFTGTVSGITSAMVGLGNVNNTSDANKPVSTAQQTALDLKAPLASPIFTGNVGFSGTLTLPTTTGTTIGSIWRNGSNLEFKDTSNVTQIILNSAGNLSNLSNKQTSLNNLVGTLTPNRVLKSNGTNVVLAQVDLTTDVSGNLPISQGGTGSNIQNFMDLTNAQTIAGMKTFSSRIQIQATNPGFWLDETDTPTKGAYLVLDNGNVQIQRRSTAFGAFEGTIAQINIVTGVLNLGINVPSTSTTTGTIVCPGGVGIAGAGYFGDIVQATSFQVGGTKVIGARETGWTAGTGTPNKGAYNADTATLLQVAQRVLAISQALRNHGLIN
jgi:hypothetical protein